MRILTLAHVPDELANAWLQHMRDFDVAHPDCHFQTVGDAPDMSMADLLNVMKVTPGLGLFEVIPTKIVDP